MKGTKAFKEELNIYQTGTKGFLSCVLNAVLVILDHFGDAFLGDSEPSFG